MVEQNGDALARLELRLRRATCVMITKVRRTTLTKGLEMLLDLPQFGTVIEAEAVVATYRLSRPNQRALKIGHN